MSEPERQLRRLLDQAGGAAAPEYARLHIKDLPGSRSAIAYFDLGDPQGTPVRMRKHYAAEYDNVAVAAGSGLVKPGKRGADKPGTRGNPRAGAQLRGKSEPRRTR